MHSKTIHNMLIYLIGLPGSGKSTLGKEISDALAYDFIDLDQKIEEHEGMTIPNIFAQKGETYFREIERKILHLYSNRLRLVIATGGGAPCFFDNMEFILQKGLSFYLDISIEEIIRRLEKSNGQNNRPLLADKNKEELGQELTEKKRLRNPFYQRASYCISDDNISVNTILNVISPTL